MQFVMGDDLHQNLLTFTYQIYFIDVDEDLFGYFLAHSCLISLNLNRTKELHYESTTKYIIYLFWLFNFCSKEFR